MLLGGLLSVVLATATLYGQFTATANKVPTLIQRNYSPLEAGILDKRDTCSDGSRCIVGNCCGDGCAYNCCALDNGGVGCGLAERCEYDGNVFIGCCGNYVGGCTGEATRITIHTPYITVAGTAGGATVSAITTSESEPEITTSTSSASRTAVSSTESELPTTSSAVSISTSSGSTTPFAYPTDSANSSASRTSIPGNTKSLSTGASQTVLANGAAKMTRFDMDWLVALGALFF
ncbi:putative GPI anchored protein [Aspergillus ibericus CBS 121593]|uniref:GPI anchored protein n=1 Tax=Aspergillus ibericus CBS 121593 TaxID=1448316 RepID=A0A395GKN4_9EURO|nr:hypothetical protein BO80DRAFT_449657 [Aspergillus ibericus CBS 121593]RAK96060.1 hypothetical protein BO80DRAFT_449657 [Aspergillus ibericus CBS 121593]